MEFDSTELLLPGSVVAVVGYLLEALFVSIVLVSFGFRPMRAFLCWVPVAFLSEPLFNLFFQVVPIAMSWIVPVDLGGIAMWGFLGGLGSVIVSKAGVVVWLSRHKFFCPDQSWKIYFTAALLPSLVGSATAFLVVAIFSTS